MTIRNVLQRCHNANETIFKVGVLISLHNSDLESFMELEATSSGAVGAGALGLLPSVLNSFNFLLFLYIPTYNVPVFPKG